MSPFWVTQEVCSIKAPPPGSRIGSQELSLFVIFVLCVKSGFLNLFGMFLENNLQRYFIQKLTERHQNQTGEPGDDEANNRLSLMITIIN